MTVRGPEARSCRRVQIAVIGAGVCASEVGQRAEGVGEAIARSGAILVCGGLGGVMAAAARGAKRAGGLTIGVLPGYAREAADAAIDVVLPTGLGHARNVLVVAAGDAVIALPGEHGTAAEIELALKLGRPVVVLDAWRSVPGVHAARSPVEAVRAALSLVAATGVPA